MLSSPDNRSSAELESIVSQTQIRNTQIKDEIKFLERDTARDPSNSFKRTQVESLKRTFKSQLEDFQREEADYSKRYREAIARQYRVINPEATEAEVQEAANADWGDEGIFTQAVSAPPQDQIDCILTTFTAQEQPQRASVQCPGRSSCSSQRYPAHREDYGRAGNIVPAAQRASRLPGGADRTGREPDCPGQ